MSEEAKSAEYEQENVLVASELEHAIGLTLTANSNLFYNPNQKGYIAVLGASVVMCNFDDPHNQVFLRVPPSTDASGHGLENLLGVGKVESTIASVALSSNGTFLAVGYGGGLPDVRVWDMEEQVIVWTLDEHDREVHSLEFSHDERLLITVDGDSKLAIWDVKTGEIVNLMHASRAVGKISQVRWGGFAKDVKRRDTSCYQFATCGDNLCMWRLDPYTGELSFTLAESHRNVRMFNCVEFVHTPDTCGRAGYMDEWIVGGSSSGDFAAFMVKPSKTVGEGAPVASLVCTVPCCKGGVVSMARNPRDKSAIVIGGADCTVTMYLYDPNKSSWIDSEGFRTGAPVRGLAVSGDGKEVMAATEDGRIVTHDCGMFQNQPFRLVSTSHGGPVTAVAFAPSTDEEFATCSEDGTVKVWNMNDFSVKTEMCVRGTTPTSVAFSFDAVISGWKDGKVRCHHANTGEVLWEIDNAHTDGVSALCLSNNKRFLVTGGELGDVRVWELRMRELVLHLKEHSRAVTQLVMFDDDIHALSCSRDRSFLCWDLRAEKRMSSHIQRMGGLNGMALTRDQSIVITVGQERNITFWDLRDDAPVFVIDSNNPDMHKDEASCVAVSHTGTLFATGGNDEIIKLWRISDDGTPELVENNRGHSGTVLGMAFSKDDKQLVSVGRDGAIFVWNLFVE